MTKKLSKKSYWDSVHKRDFSFMNFKLLSGISNYQFYDIVTKHVSRNKYKNVFEIGCGAGNFLMTFNKLFNLEAGGVEYSEEGYIKTKQNFEKNKVKINLIKADFFDPKFQSKNKGKYDIVISLGFIEHFSNPVEVVNQHFQLIKDDGMVIITIPNLSHIYKYLLEKEVVDIHNLKIMNIKTLSKIFKNYKILELKYSGGLFNFGLLTYKNFILEKIRFLFFVIQRIIFDPVFILLFKMGIDFSNRYTSPQIIIIAKKNGKK